MTEATDKIRQRLQRALAELDRYEQHEKMTELSYDPNSEDDLAERRRRFSQMGIAMSNIAYRAADAADIAAGLRNAATRSITATLRRSSK